jgi:hypothetical protein
MANGKSEMISTLLLQPDVPCVVVNQFDNERTLALWQSAGNLLHQLLLPLDVNGREQFVYVDSLQ